MNEELKIELLRFLETIANSTGELITEYHWREACGLIHMIEENDRP